MSINFNNNFSPKSDNNNMQNNGRFDVRDHNTPIDLWDDNYILNNQAEAYERTLKQIVATARTISGYGQLGSEYTNELSQLDRFGRKSMLLPPTEYAGYTFITCPDMNMSTGNLNQDETMQILGSADPNAALAFSIRLYLGNPTFAKNKYVRDVSSQFSLFNSDTPFIYPLCNLVRSVSGFPSFYLDTIQSDGGFYGEDQTIAGGSDFNQRSYDLTLQFEDVQGDYIFAMIYFWIRYIALVRKGVLYPWNEKVSYGILDYTCSIYRFVMDPSRTQIMRWAKATGCFPKSIPLGEAFDFDQGQDSLERLRDLSVTFQCGGAIEYMRPAILEEFNMISIQARSDASVIEKALSGGWERGRFIELMYKAGYIAIPADIASYNYCGFPLIDSHTGSNQIYWFARKEELPTLYDKHGRVRDYRDIINEHTGPYPGPNSGQRPEHHT